METLSSVTPCAQCPLQYCDGLRPLAEMQLAYMQEYKSGEVFVGRGQHLLKQNTTTDHLYTVLGGVMLRYRTLDDGRRQIVNFLFPGDLIGLQSAFDDEVCHSVEALVDSRLCRFEKQDFHDLIVKHPSLGFDITWLAAKEETALESHLVSLGQRSAKERVTYLAVWLLNRASATGMLEDDNRLTLPIKQAQIADMLGLSLVHTNRTLKALSREGLVDWKPGRIRIADIDKAAKYAEVPRYSKNDRPFI